MWVLEGHALVGQRLGTYRIERLIEQGGSAAVFLAEDVRPELGRMVALKVLSKKIWRRIPGSGSASLRESRCYRGVDR